MYAGHYGEAVNYSHFKRSPCRVTAKQAHREAECVTAGTLCERWPARRGGRSSAGSPVLMTPSAHILHGREAARHSSILV